MAAISNQTFRLFNANENLWVPFEDNINMFVTDYIKSKFEQKISSHNWSNNLRYVALGSYGDCVIYDNNKIELIADSQ